MDEKKKADPAVGTQDRKRIDPIKLIALSIDFGRRGNAARDEYSRMEGELEEGGTYYVGKAEEVSGSG